MDIVTWNRVSRAHRYLKVYGAAHTTSKLLSFLSRAITNLYNPASTSKMKVPFLDCEALSSQTGRCLLFAQRRRLRCLALASLLTLPTDTSCLRSYATCTFQTQTFTSQQQHHHHQVTNLQAPTKKKTTAAAPNQSIPPKCPIHSKMASQTTT